MTFRIIFWAYRINSHESWWYPNEGISIRNVAKQLNVAKGTVQKYTK